MVRVLLPLLLAAPTTFGQYKMEPAGAPPSDLASGIAQLLGKEGFRIVSSKPLFEIWFRSSMPSGPKSSEESTTLATVPFGSFMGVIRFLAPGADRRGQPIKPGLYTLRHGLYPINGDHQGVAPQRDFLLMSPVAADPDPAATPDYKKLVEMSKQASGTPHPAVLSYWKADTDFTPGFAKQGENDWVVQTKIGDTPVAVIVIGKVEG